MSLVMSCMIEYHNGNEAAANDEEWEVGVISRSTVDCCAGGSISTFKKMTQTQMTGVTVLT